MEALTRMAQVSGLTVSDWSPLVPQAIGVAGGPGGTLWASHWDPPTQLLHAWHWDGTTWTGSGPIETRVGKALTDNLSEAGMARTGPCVSDGGVVWFDGLVRFDGQSYTAFEVPATEDLWAPAVYSVSHGRDGSLWLTVVERVITDPTDAQTSLYVITPGAVAAAE